jgi:hypothetical protein
MHCALNLWYDILHDPAMNGSQVGQPFGMKTASVRVLAAALGDMCTSGHGEYKVCCSLPTYHLFKGLATSKVWFAT